MTDSMLPLLASSTEAGTIGIATDAIVRWLLDHGQGLFDAVNALILGMAELCDCLLYTSPSPRDPE